MHDDESSYKREKNMSDPNYDYINHIFRLTWFCCFGLLLYLLQMRTKAFVFYWLSFVFLGRFHLGL